MGMVLGVLISNKPAKFYFPRSFVAVSVDFKLFPNEGLLYDQQQVDKNCTYKQRHTQKVKKKSVLFCPIVQSIIHELG